MFVGKKKRKTVPEGSCSRLPPSPASKKQQPMPAWRPSVPPAARGVLEQRSPGANSR